MSLSFDRQSLEIRCTARITIQMDRLRMKFTGVNEGTLSCSDRFYYHSQT